MDFKKLKAEKIILFLFLIINLLLIADYSFTWDEPGHLEEGKAVVLYLQGKSSRLGGMNYGIMAFAPGYLLKELLADKLNLLPVDAAFHLVIIFYGFLGLWVIFRFCQKYIGRKEGLLAVLFICFMPRFIGHLHQNIKDVPAAATFALSIFLYARTIDKSNFKNWLLAAIGFGIALATKINAVFIPVIILLWLMIEGLRANKFNLKKTLVSLRPVFLIALASFFAGVLLAVIFWPSAWSNPLARIVNVFHHFRTVWVGNRVIFWEKAYQAGINVPWFYSWGFLAVTTPFLTLILAIWGMVLAFKKWLCGNKIIGLLFLWFLVPLLKYLNPKIVVYDDIRQFMEVLFPLAVFAGIGGGWIIKKIEKMVKKRFIILGVYLIFLVYFLIPFFKLHPYEMLYFNETVSGLKGVHKKALFDIDFWGISLAEAARWLNNNAKEGDRIYADWGVIDVVKQYIGDDLNLSPHEPWLADYLIVLNRQSFYYIDVSSLTKDQKPIFTVEREGAPFSWVYKLPQE